MDAAQEDTSKNAFKRLAMCSHMRKGRKSDQHRPSTIKRLLEKLFSCHFLFGLLSLTWLIVRTGTKPTRAVYPCQKVAAANADSWLTLFVITFFLGLTGSEPKKHSNPKRISWGLGIVLLLFFAIFTFKILTSGGSTSQSISGGKEQGKMQSLQGVSSDLFVVENTDGTDNGFEKLIALMQEQGLSFYKREGKDTEGGTHGLIAKDDLIIIKVNSQWDQRGGTNTDLVKSIIEAIVGHPDRFIGEIVVADNGQAQFGARGRGGSLDWNQNNARDRSQSMQKVVDMFSDSYRASVYLWDRITENRVGEYSEGDLEDGYILDSTPSPRTKIQISYPKFKTEFGTYISFKKGIWDQGRKAYDSGKLKVLNLPILKPHSIYGVTAAVKHYMGVVSDKLTGHTSHNSVGLGGMGTQMAETRMPVLNVLDAIWISPRSGPRVSYSQAVENNMIAASIDPIALDYWSAKNILMKVAKSENNPYADSMNPDIARRGSFGYWLRLSMDELNKAGYETTLGDENIRVFFPLQKSPKLNLESG